MTTLDKYEQVNKCETLEELALVIETFADEDGMIQGRERKFNSNNMASACRVFQFQPVETLTREFGIRQQGMYIRHYLSSDLKAYI